MILWFIVPLLTHVMVVSLAVKDTVAATRTSTMPICKDVRTTQNCPATRLKLSMALFQQVCIELLLWCHPPHVEMTGPVLVRMRKLGPTPSWLDIKRHETLTWHVESLSPTQKSIISPLHVSSSAIYIFALNEACYLLNAKVVHFYTREHGNLLTTLALAH